MTAKTIFEIGFKYCNTGKDGGKIKVGITPK